MTRCALVLAALTTLPGFLSGPARAGDPPPAVPELKLFLTGTTKLTAGKLGGFKELDSWRFEFFEDGSFTMNLLEEDDRDSIQLGGTFVTTGKVRHCTFDPLTIEVIEGAMAEEFEGVTSVSVTLQKLKVVVGPKRPSRRLNGTVKLDVATGSGTQKAVLKFSGSGVPRRVLVLSDVGDGGGPAWEQVVLALLKRKHVPIDGGYYQIFADATLLHDEIETVVWLQAATYADTLAGGMDQEFVDFVQAGGGLVRTEWGSYEAGPEPSLLIDGLLPVVAPESDYDYGAKWQRVAGGHPLGRKVPKSFATPLAGYTFVEEKPGATVVYRSADGYPLLTGIEAGAGRVIHVNHDMAYSVSALPKPVVQIMTNAVEFGAP